jgi:CheY-like chemotaxis protein
MESESPLILVIDDSPTIRKMVECHLSQAGYRVAMAPDAEAGLVAAGQIRPDLILLDHQLPGTTGDAVCRQLLASEATATIPVVVSSAMRNRAFASYTEFPNVVDQIPKPFTPEMLRTGVANALQVGALVVRAQATGCAMPEAVGEPADAALDGTTATFPLRAVLDFLNNGGHGGRLTLEVEKERFRFHLGGGRVQAVVAPTASPERLAGSLPADLADLAPLLAVTLGERVDPSMSGIVRMLERSLADPRRLRALLRAQAAILTHEALGAGPGTFSFEPDAALPPMFGAFPLQSSLAALAVEGVALGDPGTDADAALVFARLTPRGGNLDRAGLSPAAMKAYALFDGALPLGEVAGRAGLSPAAASDVARGLERVGLLERRRAGVGAAVLVLEEDADAVRLLLHTLGPDGLGHQVRAVRDRVGAQLLLRRQRFDLVILALDRPGAEAFVPACRGLCPEGTRLVGLTGLEDEDELARLDALKLDGILTRPLAEADVRSAAAHLLRAREPAGAA